MIFSNLGNTDIKVSKICLGTMTFGEQNTLEDGFEQMDYAVSKGVNFFDTAEVYSVPVKEKTQGSTEKIVGQWIKERGNREDIILATKVTGPGAWVNFIRNGPRFNRQHILEAIEGNLKRLQTDYVDLYQLHWPERATNFFGKLGYEGEDNGWEENFLEVIETMGDLIKQGKVRHFGLSNETPWATMKYLLLADKYSLPRIVSVQNPYNLLNRTYEVGMSEVSIREEVSLLAYSPLAFGVLSGKYIDENPPDGRINLFPNLGRYNSKESQEAVKEYVNLAREFNMTPTHLALAFVNQRPFMTSNIIGATKMVQLKENIESVDVQLSQELMALVQEIHKKIPNPAP